MISSISSSTSFISLMASGTMAAMIHKSGRLSIPYGRLIYALSLSDVVQSFAILIAPFFIPKTQSAGFSLAMGNVHTCDFVGFILPFGSTAVCMYTCSLCIYYVCKLKLNMTDSVFYQKVEKKLHIFIIFYNTVFSAAGVATKSVNPVTQMDFCHYSRKPWNCDRSFDCERGHYARFFTIFYGPIGTPLVCLVEIIACMAGVIWHVISRERVFLSNTTGKSSLQRAYDRMKAYLSKRNDETQQNLSDQQPNESDVHYIARVYRRETMMQAFLYVIVFLCTYGVSIYVAICNAIDVDVSMILGLLFLFVYPLGGLFNVLVYSRPAILAFRLEHSNYSWCKAFSLVVMAGGANPNAEAEEAGGLCCLRRGKDDDAVSKASKIDLRHQGYAQDADKSFTQGGRGSKDKTSTEGDGSGDSVLRSVQSHNLSSTGLRRENPKPENSVLLNRNICESSDI
jgi:ABC-type multidrug transport system fused ATPase/permease subunit